MRMSQKALMGREGMRAELGPKHSRGKKKKKYRGGGVTR